MTDVVPPLATLAPFEAACRHRNFTKAAAELHYSQASVSRRIGELEAHLGVTLFERRRHDVVPTDDAEQLAAAVRSSFGEIAAAARRIRRRHGQPSLTVFTDLSLATTVIAPVIGPLQREHPDAEIRVVSSFEPIHATDEQFDIGVQYGRDRTTSMTVEPIADDTVFPVCSPELADAIARPTTAEDLAGHRLLHVDYGHRDWTDWHQFFADVDTAPHGLATDLVFTSYHVCLDVAERGEGIALGWQRTVQPRIDRGALVRLEGLEVPVPDAIRAYWPPTTLDQTAETFLSLLRQSLAGGS